MGEKCTKWEGDRFKIKVSSGEGKTAIIKKRDRGGQKENQLTETRIRTVSKHKRRGQKKRGIKVKGGVEIGRKEKYGEKRAVGGWEIKTG